MVLRKLWTHNRKLCTKPTRKRANFTVDYAQMTDVENAGERIDAVVRR